VSNATVDELPEPLVHLLDELQESGVFTAAQRPDSCCINVYERGTWLPPHVDSEAFDRPFFTVSLLSAQSAVFGERIDGTAGEWHGQLRFVMPVGSVLRLEGGRAHHTSAPFVKWRT
jgi:alkylated DNA repair dioxygenase AlkB